MRVLQAHCRYLNPGGEDTVVEEEAALLRGAGHDVELWQVRNADLAARPVTAGLSATWSRGAQASFRATLERVRPDVVHVHNTFYAASPAIIRTAKALRIPVVATLHNYRIFCAQGMLLRDDRPCFACVERAVPWPGIVHGCYHASAARSAGVALAQVTHRALGTWSDADVLICLTGAALDLFARAGLPRERLAVLPNFAREAPGQSAARRQGVALVSRLTRDKGIDLALEAWTRHADLPPLTILGDGPLRGAVEAACLAAPGRIRFLGHVPADEVRRAVGAAAQLIFPSRAFEGMPMTVVEAFALGTPVVAPSTGAVSTMVHAGVNGLTFTLGSADELAAAVRTLAGDEGLRERLARGAREAYEEHYTPKAHLAGLETIYRRAMASR